MATVRSEKERFSKAGVVSRAKKIRELKTIMCGHTEL